MYRSAYVKRFEEVESASGHALYHLLTVYLSDVAARIHRNAGKERPNLSLVVGELMKS